MTSRPVGVAHAGHLVLARAVPQAGILVVVQIVEHPERLVVEDRGRLTHGAA